MRLRSMAGAAIALLLTAPLLHAASQLADIRVIALLTQADRAGLALRFDEAAARTDDAIALAEKIADRVGLAMAYRAKGNVLMRAGRGKDALSWFQRSADEFEKLGNRAGVADALTGLIGARVLLRDTAGLRELADRALEIQTALGNDRGRALLFSHLVRSGVAHDEEPAYIAEILAIGRRLSDDNLISEALMLRAGREFSSGNYVVAAASFEEAIPVLERSGDVGDVAVAYLSLGRVFRAHGDYEGAIRRYQRAIDLLAPTKERYTIIEAINSKAIALGYLNRPKDALAAYEHALVLARESGNQRMIDFIEGNYGNGLLAAGEYERAIPIFESAIAKKPERGLLGYRYHGLGIALARTGKAADALSPAREAVAIAREGNNVESLPDRLHNLARTLSMLDRFDEAWTASREALQITEEIRGKLLPMDFLKRGFADRSVEAHAQAVSLLAQLGRASEALEHAERGRARAFLDLMASRETRTETPKPAASNAASGLASEALGKPLDAAGVQRMAARLNTVIIEYWINAESTEIWVVKPGAEPVLTRVPIKLARLAEMVAATTAPLRTSSGATTRGTEDLAGLPMRGLGLATLSRDDKSAWGALYKVLVEPIKTRLPPRGSRITIVPHGPLFQLSFAALRSAAGRYLVEDHELHYAPSISTLDVTARRQREVTSNLTSPWAVVGNPVTLPAVADRPLRPLPGAAREVAAVSALAPRANVVKLDGPRADEAALAKALESSRPSVLHFATHGFVFDDPKQAPFLALNRRGTTAAEDGKLTLDEVYGLRLDTDLVVLSACRTGSGQLSSDGVIGLTRGFFYAGSPSVLATYWDVVDDATARLMSGFYRAYVKSRAKGSSLRSAQLALLADLRAGRVVVTAGGRNVTLPEHPLLWAAFFLSGEP